MLQSDLSTCLCGCKSSLIFSFGESVAPARGEMLYYICPSSQDLMSFSSRGHWDHSVPEGKHQVVRVSRTK